MTIDGKRKFIVNTAYVALICAIVFFVLKYLTIWLLPFFIGFICALILQKPVGWLSKHTHTPRVLWSSLFVLFILGLVFGLIIFLGVKIYNEVYGLIGWMKSNIPVFQETFQNISDNLSDWLDTLPEGLADALRNAPLTMAENGVSAASNAVTSFATSVISNIPGLMLTTIISIVASCFITNDYNRITAFILKQFSPKNQHLIRHSKQLFMENVLKMLRGYILIFLIIFVELFVGFLIFDVPYAGTLAFFIAIIDIVPVLGTGTALIPWGIVELVSGNSTLGLELILLYVFIIVVRNIIEPKIIGKQVGLPPIVTLMAMYLGLNTVGLLGMICFPIMIIIVAKLQEAGLIHIWKSVKTDELSDSSDQGSQSGTGSTDAADSLNDSSGSNASNVSSASTALDILSDASGGNKQNDLQNNKETVV